MKQFLSKVVTFITPAFRKVPLLFIAVPLALISIMPIHWSEVAKTSFWWNFWTILATVVIIACFAFWFYMRGQEKRSK